MHSPILIVCLYIAVTTNPPYKGPAASYSRAAFTFFHHPLFWKFKSGMSYCVLAHVVANNLKYHSWPSLNCLTLKKVLWPFEGTETKYWTQHHTPQEPSLHTHSSGKLKSCAHYFVSSVSTLGTCRSLKACRQETINNALMSVVLQLLVDILHKA
jgi:hypothetical protein